MPLETFWTKNYGDGGEGYTPFSFTGEFDEVLFWDTDRVGTTAVEGLKVKKENQDLGSVKFGTSYDEEALAFPLGAIRNLEVKCGKHVNSIQWKLVDDDETLFVGGDEGWHHVIVDGTDKLTYIKGIRGLWDQENGCLVQIAFQLEQYEYTG